ncbi:MAG: hypothetical protein O0X93_08245 [Methanocorpusculum sp.]|nr:hypothetical protein [Methanocorpusculum sp.]MDE2523128.1 hypothetical protein [Methanocorpusculum sp.]MDE2525162.1 hypothetical protein [Methanocorpusculum sp.]
MGDPTVGTVPVSSADGGSASMDKATGGHVEGDGGSLTYTIDENGVVHYKMVEPDGKVTEWTSDGSITQ